MLVFTSDIYHARLTRNSIPIWKYLLRRIKVRNFGFVKENFWFGQILANTFQYQQDMDSQNSIFYIGREGGGA